MPVAPFEGEESTGVAGGLFPVILLLSVSVFVPQLSDTPLVQYHSTDPSSKAPPAVRVKMKDSVLVPLL